ncbi:YraN family protein [Nocardia sp. CS682]|uniref:YraN family protein n=1 Tax=Nocardia sp. CS682 TaxID=1047172 RepID=UPI001074ECE5|nr:YraN family protein [Nocardia sp. CS682]QBS44928.1 YraN family protein [Nocardia sp. CS682]
MNPDPTPQTSPDELVVQYLTDEGMKVLARNWRCAYGKISLIAEDAGTTVFIHLRTRASQPFQVPAEAVTFAKQQRLRRLSLLWLAEQDGPWWRVRFDVAAVIVEPGREPEVQYFRAAF